MYTAQARRLGPVRCEEEEERRYGAGQWYLVMIAIELVLALGIGLFDEVQMSQKVVVVPPRR